MYSVANNQPVSTNKLVGEICAPLCSDDSIEKPLKYAWISLKTG